jgi:hypothetical protein
VVAIVLFEIVRLFRRAALIGRRTPSRTDKGHQALAQGWSPRRRARAAAAAQPPRRPTARARALDPG